MNESSDEWTQVFESKGILVIILWDMISNDLVNWGLLIAFVSTGFGVAYTILQPNRSNYCRSSSSSKAGAVPTPPLAGCSTRRRRFLSSSRSGACSATSPSMWRTSRTRRGATQSRGLS